MYLEIQKITIKVQKTILTTFVHTTAQSKSCISFLILTKHILDIYLSYQQLINYMPQHSSPQLKFFVKLAKIQARLSRSLDMRLNGISFTEFTILQHLHDAKDEMLRRTDLAEKVGLTASGITRLLLPMEKIGLVGRDSDERDARVKFVKLTKAGKEKFADELIYMNDFAESKLPQDKSSLEKMTEILESIQK